MWCPDGKAAILGFLILSFVILLIMWFVTPVFAMAMFLWFIFAFAILILMVWNRETTALGFPILFIVLGAFFWYAAK
jgi:hypothetical protein